MGHSAAIMRTAVKNMPSVRHAMVTGFHLTVESESGEVLFVAPSAEGTRSSKGMVAPTSCGDGEGAMFL